jgi:hypothetical protein
MPYPPRLPSLRGEMMLLGGLNLHGVMRRLTISMSPCGVTFHADLLELWAALSQWLTRTWDLAMQLKWDLLQLLTPTLMTPTWSCKTFVISKMRIEGKSKGLR